ncbi:MAG: hypothetical protein Q8R39_00115 [bacterium]|nr:hypothetical protein [bacterium]
MSVDEINLSGLDLAPNAAERSSDGTPIHKTTIITVVALFVLAALGGGYFYYRSIYQPRVYVQTIVPLYESAGLLGSEAPGEPALQGPSGPLDYTGAAEAIAARARKLTAARAEIATLEPPNAKLAGFHAALLDVLDRAAAASAEAETHARFFEKLLKLKEELGAIHETVSTPEQQQSIRTVGGLSDAWVPHFTKAKTVGADAFNVKIRALGKDDTQIAGIVTLWDEIVADIDFFIELFGSLRPETRLENLQTVLTPAQNSRGEKSFGHFEELIRQIDALTAALSATVVLDLGVSLGEDDIELSEKAYQTYRALEDLKRRYLP